MKIKIILSLIVTVSLSCAKLPVYAVNSNIVSTAPIQSIVNNKINFEVVDNEDAPKDLLEMISKSKENKGFISKIDDATGYIYIAVLSGYKPTGGYSIEVTSIEHREGKTNVFVKELSPSKDLFLTQAITYPYTIVKAKGITPNITIENTKEQHYEHITNNMFESDILNKNWKNIKGFDNVIENKEWTIKFNKSVENIVLTSNTVYILDSSGKKLNTSLSVSDDKKRVIVKPIENYEIAKTYYLFISQYIFGKEMDKSDIKGYRMMFTTKYGLTVE